MGQAVLRALRLSSLSLRIVALDMSPRSPALYACDVGYLIPSPDDPTYLTSLGRILARESIDVLIAGSDPELPVLAAGRDELERAGARVVVGRPDAVAAGHDKLAGARLFRASGFPFVQTVPARDGRELAREVGFPLVVKPNPGSASRGVAVVFDDEALMAYVGREDYVVQEFALPNTWGPGRAAVSGDGGLRQEEEVSCQVLYDHERNRLGTFCSVNRLKDGVPVFVDPQELSEVERTAEGMALALVERGLVGPVNFQCRVTRDGPKVFEVNARFTGITGVRAAMGWNEVEAVIRRVAFDEPLDAVRERLNRRFDQLGMRYVDECLVPRTSWERMAT